MLMEGREGDNIAVGRCRHILMAGQKLLHRIGPPTKKTTLDEALHACMGNFRAVPQINRGCKWLWRSGSYRSRALAVD